MSSCQGSGWRLKFVFDILERVKKVRLCPGLDDLGSWNHSMVRDL